MIITRQMYLKGREKKFASEYTEEVFNNSSKIIARASELLSRVGVTKVEISSGWRPKSINSQVGGSPNSQHIYGNAIDILDPDKSIGQWCISNLESLSEIGLWMESLIKTHTSDVPNERWVHLQCVPPKSGSRIFLP